MRQNNISLRNKNNNQTEAVVRREVNITLRWKRIPSRNILHHVSHCSTRNSNWACALLFMMLDEHFITSYNFEGPLQSINRLYLCCLVKIRNTKATEMKRELVHALHKINP